MQLIFLFFIPILTGHFPETGQEDSIVSYSPLALQTANFEKP